MKKTRLTLIGLLLALNLCAQSYDAWGNEEQLRKLQIAEVAITNLYVDTVNEQKLVEDAIRGMLKALDPHSTYTTAKETKAFTEPMQGSFEGIGIQFNIVQDTLLVIQTITDGPSEKAGLIAGDRIISVDDSLIAGVKMAQEEIIRRLRGPKGSLVKLGIARHGIAEKLYFTVKRDKIPLNTIDASYMIRPRVGYIKIQSFGATTYKEFIEAVQKLRQEGMKDLIIDLQQNGGGLLQTAVMIANEFLNKNDLIVYTQGRKASGRQEYRAQGDGTLRQGKVFVLIDEFSASAAEILSGAIQDQDRGQIVGRRSFGKGLVQRPITFKDGSMMRLTIAHYYTPSGRCIQKPYTKGDQLDYALELDKRYKHGELYSKDSIHLADSTIYYTLRRHRAVYGGGGIMPDFFVPLDTTQYTSFHRKLAAQSAIITNTLQYVDKNREKLRKIYPDFATFNAKFNPPKDLIQAIVKDGEEAKVKPKDDKELQETLPMLSLQVKALVGRDLWSLTAYFQIMNETNPIVMKAVRLIE